MSLLSILIASLLGSPHCAAMCGGFAGIAAHSPRPRFTQLLYHFGRLLTYLLLGGIAGYFGHVLNKFGVMIGINRIAAMLTGIFMIAAALAMLSGRTFGVANFFPKWLLHLPRGMISNSSKFLYFRGLSLGVFSTLLPCGWLYTYVALAAATGSVLTGFLVMFIFWFGTLPILLTIGSIAHLLSAATRKHVPTLVAILMLCAGFFALSGHLVGFESGQSKIFICAP